MFEQAFKTQTISFEISIRNQAEATLGVPFKIFYNIKRLSFEKGIYYACFEDAEDRWIVVGGKRLTLDFQQTDEILLPIQIIPIQIGLLNVPEILIQRIQKDAVKFMIDILNGFV